MKTLLAVGILVACLASAAPAQVVRRGALRAADRELIESRAGAAAAHWQLDAQAPSGAVTRIVGRIELHGATDEQRCADLVARYGALFDVTPGLELDPPRTLRTGKSGSRFLHLQQSVRGFVVGGHGLWVELDRDGNAACVHGIVSAAAAALPAPAITAAQAVAIADAHLAANGFPASGWMNGPHLLGARIEPIARGLREFWRIGAVPTSGLAQAVDVDAQTGAVLAQFFNGESFGEGTYQVGAAQVPFKTGNGKGVVYKDFKSAAANASSQQSLPELGLQSVVTDLAEDGTLFGRFATVLTWFADFSVAEIVGPGHKFLGFPSDVSADDADLFDASNCYFHLTKFALAMTKVAGATLPTDFSMPALVNTPNFPVNAAFIADDPGLGTGVGFMIYGDDSFTTGFLADDVTRDPTVMCHEYTHAIVDLSGIDFSVDGGDTPGRAVNEALADAFAASYFKDPRIGFPLAQLASSAEIDNFGLTLDGGLRNLAAPKTLLDDLFDVVDMDGFPEEHSAGHIFGCTLWHVREVVKQKVFEGLLFDSLFNWPQSLAELGYTEYTPDNAGQAHIDFFAACLSQLVSDAVAGKGLKQGLNVLGAAMQNGCLGAAEFLVTPILDASQGGSFKIASAFLGTTDGHVVGLSLNAGQSMDITLTGDKKSGTQVDLDFSEPQMGGLSFPNAAVIKGNKLTLKGVQVNQGGIYGIFPLNAGSKNFTPQKYTLTIKVKG